MMRMIEQRVSRHQKTDDDRGDHAQIGDDGCQESHNRPTCPAAAAIMRDRRFTFLRRAAFLLGGTAAGCERLTALGSVQLGQTGAAD